MNLAPLASGAALALSGAASASFVGFDTDITQVGGKTVFRVFARFNSADDVLLNAFGIANLSASDLVDSDLAGGSWAPQFTQDATMDSYLTIGGLPGFANSTNADPGWGGAGFNQPGVPNGAGWFNTNPPNLQGKVGADLRTIVGQFVYASGPLPFSCPLTVGYNQGLGTATMFASGTFLFGPTPGVLVAFGLAGLAGRRHRSR